ncbi:MULTISPECIES: high-potential iron-sulfur protein [Burkholderiaceae]|uniref:High-potential iron-sulfur protein n=2 Tax=Burkholderiaceae TaxID=119060 RepID=A4JV35_BURVG|nr:MULTISPECIES: high-potential iron-sulfur protein [Burkholderiaceae]ABO60138.1 High potential iron-sulfur protein [Burkholderia vietnamiensis G4]ASW03700.1 High potential iron-sulfur protein [Paraburkholderia aromaticivorans]MBR8008557.1 high-potential iron-sulfur protein [Burkholderia vietnamiensis]MBR8054697.1 high-potential iron-sulfur protein [Burkholderia vietnamiensis]MCA7889854.1 high-potential iron-sulfur protein [Burkholderia contaminans]
MKFSRRTFVLFTAGLASSMILERHAAADVATVLESDANAKALGYRTDASKVDKAKYPQFQAGQACASCQFFQGKAGDATAPCTIFGGKLVNAKGWCSAYVKKA